VKRFSLSLATCCSAQYANNLKIYRLLLSWLAVVAASGASSGGKDCLKFEWHAGKLAYYLL